MGAEECGVGGGNRCFTATHLILHFIRLIPLFVLRPPFDRLVYQHPKSFTSNTSRLDSQLDQPHLHTHNSLEGAEANHSDHEHAEQCSEQDPDNRTHAEKASFYDLS